MHKLLPLPVVLPLLVAAVISALNPLFRRRRRALDAIAIGTAAAVAVVLGILMAGSAHGDAVYWFAGFRPRHGVVIGIDFTASPLAAGLGCLAAVLVTAAMLFSWQYFERVSTYYHALMLAFLAGMAGFCLTGDIFDMFVWFELMGVAAYALTAYRPEERGSLQGALNFAITNSVGSYLALSGIAVLYGRTGALNMAQIGRALGHRAAGRPGCGVVRANHRGPAGQGRDRALPVLARGRDRGRADPGERAVLRGDGGDGQLRRDPGVLVDVRPGARPPRGDQLHVRNARAAHRRSPAPRSASASGT